MSRKTLILCLSALGALIAALAVAIALLYSGTGTGDGTGRKEVSSGDFRPCCCVIPSDAVLVASFARAESACAGVLSAFEFPSTIAEKISDGTLASLKKAPLAVSLHYSGKVLPLYVFGLSKVSDIALNSLKEVVSGCGLYYDLVGDYLAASESETLVRAAARHYQKKVSVYDTPGFEEAAESVDGDNILVISNLHAQKVMPSIFTRRLSRHGSFVERVSDWMAFDISGRDYTPLSLSGPLLFDGDSDEFISVLSGCVGSVSEISGVLPSYTMFAFSFPFRNHEEYARRYRSFVDSRQGLQSFLSRQKSMEASTGIAPSDFFARLGVKEVATASFMVGSALEKINLIRISNKDAALVFKGTGLNSFRNYTPAVHTWAYPSVVASVYGPLFSLPDESCFTYADGWIVTGSRAAIDEYVSRDALGYTLEEYFSDAGKSGMLSSRPAVALAYFSVTEDRDALASYFGTDALGMLRGWTNDSAYAPVLMYVTADRKDVHISVDLHSLTLQKTEAPTYERDTLVPVPAGPFKVRNSHTGKMNTFYQNAQKAICLRDENGKDLWGVPFGKSLCGRAGNVDYYANGKLQIIFASGSSIYVIDRLGRYVSGFPLDLGQEIVLGPDVYDFSGARRYNIMVLHRDNTVQMYNLKGKKPQAWKGITAEETIKDLPERISVGGKDFWVVRTSIQTLVFPFYGGEPLTVLEGNAKIRPDSQVKVIDGTSVQVSCYDGKDRTISLVR